jgi:hypothetical protein
VLWILALIAAPVLFVWLVGRGRRDFDETVRPPDDLRRADDGGTQSLGLRDGTGGLV